MSSYNSSDVEFSELAAEIGRRLTDAADTGDFGQINDDEFSRLFGSAIRYLAAKAHAGELPPPHGGNKSITPTDAVIACTAILESVNLAAFELAAWQAVTPLGSKRNETPLQSTE